MNTESIGNKKDVVVLDTDSIENNTSITISEANSQRKFKLKRKGTYRSRGYCNGYSVYEGINGGYFYLGLNGWKSYVPKSSVNMI